MCLVSSIIIIQHGSAPPYLADYFILVSAFEGQSSQRSVATSQLCVPCTKTVTISPRAIAVSSPTAWNNLSVDLHDPNLSFSCFRKKLKTYLFKISFTLWGVWTSICDCALLAAFETFLWIAFDNNNPNQFSPGYLLAYLLACLYVIHLLAHLLCLAVLNCILACSTRFVVKPDGGVSKVFLTIFD